MSAFSVVDAFAATECKLRGAVMHPKVLKYLESFVGDKTDKSDVAKWQEFDYFFLRDYERQPSILKERSATVDCLMDLTTESAA